MTGPHGKPTTLDRIEARAQEVLTDNAPDEWGYGYEHMGDMWTALATSARDVLALVAVARAARRYEEPFPTDDDRQALIEALARLDGAR